MYFAVNAHWTLAVANINEKCISYYDSLEVQYAAQNVLDILLRFFKENVGGEWKAVVTDGPKQQNGFDCGVFVCTTAEFISRDRPLTFEQKDMIYFRKKMVIEIMRGELLN